MTWWQAIILGLVEGITEYLPISSTGHLIIVTSLLGLDDKPPQVVRAINTFNIVIQGGAIVAVLGLYRQRVLQMIRGLLGKDPAGLRLFINIVIAFLPAAVLGVMLADIIDRWLFSLLPVIMALSLGGVWMIWIDKRYRVDDESREWIELTDLTWPRALLIGLFQCVAMWPGTSRSMMTIAGGTICGLRPAQAAEFSFLLGLPTLGGACVYKLAQSLSSEDGSLFDHLSVGSIVIGFVVATITAALAIRWLVSYLNRHGLSVFGYYRLVLCLILGAFALAGIVNVSSAAG